MSVDVLFEIAEELNRLIKQQLDDLVRCGNITAEDAEQYAWRNEQIRVLSEKLDSELTLNDRHCA